MGYTHYLYREKNLDHVKFNNAVKDCQKIVQELNVPVQFESDNNDPPVFSPELIRFNGVNDDGHETFLIERDFTDSYKVTDKQNRFFSFCKTAYKPYDIAVTACLIVLKHHLGNAINVSSDGDYNDWLPASKACIQHLGYGDIPISKR